MAGKKGAEAEGWPPKGVSENGDFLAGLVIARRTVVMDMQKEGQLDAVEAIGLYESVGSRRAVKSDLAAYVEQTGSPEDTVGATLATLMQKLPRNKI